MPVHLPWPEQFEAHGMTEQSGPSKPGKQVHVPLGSQMLRPAQPLGQSLTEQSSPAKPSLQTHTPSTHIPPPKAPQSDAHVRWQ